MNLATAPGALAITGYCNLFGGATLTIYSGTQPSTPETALSGNTALCSYTFSTPGFSGVPTASGGFDSLSASFTSSSASPVASGTATFARATLASAAWQASHAYARGALVTNGSNLYVCIAAGTSASSGGPTTTAYGIVDGTAAWDYVGASTVAVLADFTVGTSGTDIILGTTSIQTGTTVTLSSFKIQVGVS